MFIVTGGAGFIGSNIVARLDGQSKNIAIIDWLGSDDYKWRNISKHRISEIIDPGAYAEYLGDNKKDIEGIFHMGAISSTTEQDVDAIIRNNIKFSNDIWRFCSANGVPLVYASSAATYGDGSHGFIDDSDPQYLAKLRPLNPYGWSKHLFDRNVRAEVEAGRPSPPAWAGLKFFNVYGPNEYHKGGQRSVAVQLHEQIKRDGRIRLFRSEHPDYADGAQLRDFVWVGDCVDVAMWFLSSNGTSSGLYNVGSGEARSFLDMATITFRQLGLEPVVDFIDLPEKLKGKYQYYTCAKLEKLRKAGYSSPMTSLEKGIGLFVGGYLEADDRYC